MEIYKLVYQYSHTHPIPNTPNNSLTNIKNRENLASYSKLENSHNNMQQPKSLFHSTILSISCYFHLHNWRNTYPYIGYQVGKDESLYYMQLLYGQVTIQDFFLSCFFVCFDSIWPFGPAFMKKILNNKLSCLC